MQPGLQLFALGTATLVDGGDSGGRPPAQRGEKPDTQRHAEHQGEQQRHHGRELLDAQQLRGTVDCTRNSCYEQHPGKGIEHNIKQQTRPGRRIRHARELTDGRVYSNKGGLRAVPAPDHAVGAIGLRRLARHSRYSGAPDETGYRSRRRSRISASARFLARTYSDNGNPSATATANSSNASLVSGRRRSKLTSAPSSKCGSNGTSCTARQRRPK